MATVFRLVFNVPESHLAACKTAIFAAGAGRYPNSSYSECCWTTLGTGQFRPGESARPFIGTAGSAEAETVAEVRVETPCVGEDVVRSVLTALKEFVSLADFLFCFLVIIY